MLAHAFLCVIAAAGAGRGGGAGGGGGGGGPAGAAGGEAHRRLEAGAHVGTLPYSVFQMLFKHPLTDIGLEKFLADWKKTGQSIL